MEEKIKIERCVFYSKNRPGEYIKYLKYVPENLTGKMPLLIYTTGAGSRGDYFDTISYADCVNGGPFFEAHNGRDLGMAVVELQCHEDTWFDMFDVLIEMVDWIRNTDEIDKSRVALTGVSMGGYAAWQLAASKPEWFSCLLAVCGGGMYWNAIRLKDLPIWAFHGALDTTVFPEESVKMVAAVNRLGGNAKITILPNVEHDAWTGAFSCDEMWQWMKLQKANNA